MPKVTLAEPSPEPRVRDFRETFTISYFSSVEDFCENVQMLKDELLAKGVDLSKTTCELDRGYCDNDYSTCYGEELVIRYTGLETPEEAAARYKAEMAYYNEQKAKSERGKKAAAAKKAKTEAEERDLLEKLKAKYEK